jgi:hypothetical protein
MKSFGQFAAKPAHQKAEDKARDRILTAFAQGAAAARADMARSANHYAPSSQEDQWGAWNAGYDEEEPRYVIAN